MSTTLNHFYGGWVSEQATVTKAAPAVVRLVGWVTAASAALAGIGTGGKLSIEQLQYSTHQKQYTEYRLEVVEIEAVRTPAENLKRIREVLNPAVSDLATTLGVSRQSVYNWLNGGPVAEENTAKLQDLAQAADMLAHENIAVNAALLKRKFTNGKTLFQVVQAGESAMDAAVMLVQIHKREAVQRERMNARFANRAKTATSADFDLPSSNDHA